MSIEVMARSLIEAADTDVMERVIVEDAAFESFASEYATMSSRPLYGCKGCHGG
ncbi:hypothetical protein [Hoyosella altamirensis]|uniref:Uncharacterized protein n=1 Tax=Hoyosella altamirensis TaxID=616997 RepID=A0A839RJW4_9ACTN|nr:hypothetical protein [Hoyosella altamirensis]MBB3036697.1 hypothetical protein [Hoyosella altamirensis]